MDAPLFPDAGARGSLHVDHGAAMGQSMPQNFDSVVGGVEMPPLNVDYVSMSGIDLNDDVATALAQHTSTHMLPLHHSQDFAQRSVDSASAPLHPQPFHASTPMQATQSAPSSLTPEMGNGDMQRQALHSSMMGQQSLMGDISSSDAVHQMVLASTQGSMPDFSMQVPPYVEAQQPLSQQHFDVEFNPRAVAMTSGALPTFSTQPFANSLPPVPPPTSMQKEYTDAPKVSEGKSSKSRTGSTIGGSAAGTTRRTKFRRSRTGCLVCRKRKVKCDQDGLPCKQCRIGQRDCHYEETPTKRKRKSKAESQEEACMSDDTPTKRCVDSENAAMRRQSDAAASESSYTSSFGTDGQRASFASDVSFSSSDMPTSANASGARESRRVLQSGVPLKHGAEGTMHPNQPYSDDLFMSQHSTVGENDPLNELDKARRLSDDADPAASDSSTVRSNTDDEASLANTHDSDSRDSLGNWTTASSVLTTFSGSEGWSMDHAKADNVPSLEDISNEMSSHPSHATLLGNGLAFDGMPMESMAGGAALDATCGPMSMSAGRDQVSHATSWSPFTHENTDTAIDQVFHGNNGLGGAEAPFGISLNGDSCSAP